MYTYFQNQTGFAIKNVSNFNVLLHLKNIFREKHEYKLSLIVQQ